MLALHTSTQDVRRPAHPNLLSARTRRGGWVSTLGMTASTTKRPTLQGLVTGYPGLVAKPLLRRLLEAHPRARLTVLVEEGRRKDADDDLSRLPAAQRKRVQVVVGDVGKMDLGLAGLELEALKGLTHVFHLAGIQSATADRAVLQRVNVDGVRNILTFARELTKLDRFVHFSSCFVAGDRQGVILEEDLDEITARRTPYEDSKMRGEKLVRAAMADLPVTIIRPSVVVGDTSTGEVDRFDGVYAMGILIVTSPISVPLPLPGPGLGPLHVVPVDYLTRAVCHLAADERARGKTFHVVDPNPLSARRAYELVAARAGKKLPAPPKSLSSSVAFSLAAHSGSALLSSLASSFAGSLVNAVKTPGLDRVKRSVAAVEMFDRFVLFNAANTTQLLAGTDIVCPRFDTYVDALVGFVQESLRKERKRKTKIDNDPLA